MCVCIYIYIYLYIHTYFPLDLLTISESHVLPLCLCVLQRFCTRTFSTSPSLSWLWLLRLLSSCWSCGFWTRFTGGLWHGDAGDGCQVKWSNCALSGNVGWKWCWVCVKYKGLQTEWSQGCLLIKFNSFSMQRIMRQSCSLSEGRHTWRHTSAATKDRWFYCYLLCT